MHIHSLAVLVIFRLRVSVYGQYIQKLAANLYGQEFVAKYFGKGDEIYTCPSDSEKLYSKMQINHQLHKLDFFVHMHNLTGSRSELRDIEYGPSSGNPFLQSAGFSENLICASDSKTFLFHIKCFLGSTCIVYLCVEVCSISKFICFTEVFTEFEAIINN